MPGILVDEGLDTDFQKMREESQVVSPQPSTEDVPPQSPVPPSQDEPKQAADPDLKNWVPLPTFLEEKKERQRLEAIQRELTERQTRLDERYQHIEQQLKPKAEPTPDPNQDPLGYLNYRDNQRQLTLNQFQDRLAQHEQAQAEQQHLNAITNHVGRSEQEFVKTTADYYDAVNHLREVRMAQYELAGLPPDQQMEALAADTKSWAMALMRSNKNPAEATYELAKKYGYVTGGNTALRPTDNGDARAPDQTRNADGTFAKTPNPKAEVAKQTLKTVQRGQAASKTISGPGEADDGVPSPEELATMDEESFDKWTSGKNWKKYWAAQ